MNWIDKLERRFGFIAIPHMMVLVIVGQIAALLIGMREPAIQGALTLLPAAVAAGEWWRLFTWVLVPKLGGLGPYFAIFWYLFLWSVGNALDLAWGPFRASLYLMLGIALPALGSMLLWQFWGLEVALAGGYFTITILLAYAALAPEQTLYLFFILPVKMRWVAWALGAYLAYKAVSGGTPGTVEVVCGAGNYLIYFLPAGIEAFRQQRQAMQGRAVFVQAKRKVELEQLGRPKVCAQCGVGVDGDLRLCHCERCGDDGKFWCLEHLKIHLEPPEKMGKPAKPKTKRKG